MIALLVEQCLAGRHQCEGPGLAGAALVGRVEAPHRLDLVAEEVEADGLFLAGREQVDDRAAHRIFAGVMDRVGPLVASGLQQLDQPVALDPLALGEAAVNWRMRNGVRMRWVAALAVAISSCGPWPLACSFSSVASRSAMTRRAGDARS